MKSTKAIFFALLLSCLTFPAVAEEHGRHQGGHARGIERGHGVRGPVWRGEIGRFHEHDFGLWRGGRWAHTRHDGRLGWWWVVAGTWYFYPFPIYPYPDPYQPPVVISPVVPPQYWYYCADPAGYYPYVAQCRVNWQQVPATPAQAPAPYYAPPG